MHRRRRVYDRRIWTGTLVAALLTTFIVMAALLAPEATGWLGFAGAPVYALGVMFNLARDGGMSNMTSGYHSRRIYFALLALCCIGWGLVAYLVLAGR